MTAVLGALSLVPRTANGAFDFDALVARLDAQQAQIDEQNSRLTKTEKDVEGLKQPTAPTTETSSSPPSGSESTSSTTATTTPGSATNTNTSPQPPPAPPSAAPARISLVSKQQMGNTAPNGMCVIRYNYSDGHTEDKEVYFANTICKHPSYESTSNVELK